MAVPLTTSINVTADVVADAAVEDIIHDIDEKGIGG